MGRYKQWCNNLTEENEILWSDSNHPEYYNLDNVDLGLSDEELDGIDYDILYDLVGVDWDDEEIDSPEGEDPLKLMGIKENISQQKSEVDRRKIRAKLRALDDAARKMGKSKFDDLSPKEKAVFYTQYEFKYLGGDKGKFVRRTEVMDPKDVQHAIEVAKKRAERMKKQGSGIARRGTNVGRRYINPDYREKD